VEIFTNNGDGYVAIIHNLPDYFDTLTECTPEDFQQAFKNVTQKISAEVTKIVTIDNSLKAIVV